MANTLTNLIPNILLSLDTVSREQVGFIPNVFRNSSAERAALNETIVYPVTPAATAVDMTPGVNAPDAGDQVIGNGTMVISKSKGVPVRWNGEQQRGALNELPIEGFGLGESAQIQRQAANTAAASYVLNGAVAKGAVSIVVKTGTGAINAGDLVTFAGDKDDLGNLNTYVVTTGGTGACTITIAAPGIMATSIADGTAMTVVNGSGKSFSANLAFDQMALHLVTRAPAMPIGPDGSPMDQADDVTIVTDPFTGLSFQVAVYRQFQQVLYMVSIAWGVANVKPEHTALLIH